MLLHREPTAQNLVDRAANNMSHGIDSLRDRAAPALDRASERVAQLAERGSSMVREGSRQLRDSAGRASDQTTLYIREEPFKAVVFAAAAGAIIALLAGWLGSSNRRD